MLGDKAVAATVAVSDLARAKAFYGGKLGLKETGPASDEMAVYHAGGSGLLVYKSTYAGTNQATSATWGAGADFDAIIADLRDKGVTFERYDWPGVTYRDGVHHMDGGFRAAWFKDPDGNILHVNSGS